MKKRDGKAKASYLPTVRITDGERVWMEGQVRDGGYKALSHWVRARLFGGVAIEEVVSAVVLEEVGPAVAYVEKPLVGVVGELSEQPESIMEVLRRVQGPVKHDRTEPLKK